MKTVLLTDDSVDMLALTKRILNDADYNLITASDGNEAIAMCLEKHPDLVLMDLSMPNVNGFKATEYLRGKGFTNPILALTASESGEDRQNAKDAGFDDYIVKTLEMDSLKRLLDEYLK